MRYIIDAALLQADLLNVPWFFLRTSMRARANTIFVCSTVCADYATMVNKGDAIGLDEWRELPIEQQMGFRIPISVMINIPHLRKRHPVITASDYLRLHGQDPENESSSGYWLRDWYHFQANVFETDKTKLPSLFVIENHWYDPSNVNRVDYISPAMKRRGKWERYPTLESGGYWPPMEPTELSVRLASAMGEGKAIMEWNTAKYVLASAELGGEVNLDNDEVVERVLNAHGWEVLHTFASTLGMEFAKTVVQSIKEVAHRSSIRGFKDDYYRVDADVVILAGETHLGRKPGAMRFTGPRARANYASMVVHGIVPPRWVFDLGEILASRMRELVDGRLWMGAHMRRGDFVRLSWAMELSPQAHVLRVKDRLQAGRTVVEHLGNLTTYDLDGVTPDLEQTTLALPFPDDPFYVATDERDPNARQAIADGGAVFISDLLTKEDRRRFGWPLMITDVLALVEQRLLVHSVFFYGHAMSSLAGVITNMRAARGADPRTMLID
ncbi:hypothetical protein BJV78DRAFT_12780 [Lactifluus subvellereus]|nr:hypothetical protein BJV78DRAFT_12780 [Lactifluus subvellereus]